VIALAFIVGVVLALGAAALVPERLPRPVRVAVIVAAPAAALVVWVAVHAFEGWPLATTTPPLGASFVAADVHEPDWIYLWLEPRSSSRPRAYRIRYSDRLYAQVLKAEQELKRGGTIRTQRPDRHGSAGSARPGAALPAFELRTYHEPPVALPSKTH
jgi:hypothetical protein